MPRREDKPNIPATPPAKTLSDVRLKFNDFVLCITFLEFIGITGADTILIKSRKIFNYDFNWKYFFSFFTYLSVLYFSPLTRMGPKYLST